MTPGRTPRPASRVATHPGLPDRRTLDLVDVFLFLADARIPGTSICLASRYLSRRKRVYVLTKPDLAAPAVTLRWMRSLAADGTPVFAVDCRTGEGLGGVLGFLRRTKASLDRRHPAGIAPGAVRLMLFGPPNVGKSSLANRLLGTTKAPFGARPGLTRGSHWLRGKGFLEVLDTPGVLDPSRAKGEARMKLAAVWALPESAYDPQEVALWLVQRTLDAVSRGERRESEGEGASIETAQGGVAEGEIRALACLEDFGEKRGFLGPGGAVDLIRTSTAFIGAFRRGDIGRFTLEEPPAPPEDNARGGDRDEDLPRGARVSEMRPEA